MSDNTDLCFLPAREQKRLLDAREESALGLLDAQLAQVQRLNPKVNAIVTLTGELARDDSVIRPCSLRNRTSSKPAARTRRHSRTANA